MNCKCSYDCYRGEAWCIAAHRKVVIEPIPSVMTVEGMMKSLDSYDEW